jgi:alkanesulfonate monooxygenase SsuD/methylene tetrahydromethanopterin reductase-like flavin-dependent oxidoreductase (luciferase family)
LPLRRDDDFDRSIDAVHTDLVIDPFGASMADILDAARSADAEGFDGVWTFDHFSGAVMGQAWSRDPFVTLGALAVATHRVRLGVLVANVYNRHVAQLACALNSLQSLAPGRVRCGLGSGAGRSGRFAVEPRSVGRQPAPAASRRRALVETIDGLRLLYRGGTDYAGHFVTLDGAIGIVDGSDCPDIIVGATGEATIELAAAVADGVNIRRTPQLLEYLSHARVHRPDRPFEVGVFENLDPSHSLGGDPDELAKWGVDRRTLVVTAPYPLDVIEAIGRRL